MKRTGADVSINAVNESVYADSILDTFLFLTSLVGWRVLKMQHNSKFVTRKPSSDAELLLFPEPVHCSAQLAAGTLATVSTLSGENMCKHLLQHVGIVRMSCTPGSRSNPAGNVSVPLCISQKICIMSKERPGNALRKYHRR